ncbi:hypothetical protein CR203_06395 [Salipaludibacillus neizhouensis]|uniref:HTH lacI-type domain-containing protein n=2 Tax=Salipaludibacillus neizhouensis TaxID=885475 RepID=A0A3A9KU34_9BACI|nr:LacI family DNA-binding transcriptional regulator [Salipaludibacillus neizhouensis]RKL68116.1 hypothetical protein CR203_06395 [Salipaludibacillus neizhouensis]
MKERTLKMSLIVTGKTIAQELGLSISTVDRVLNNRGNVKQETYDKVVKKAEELNYKPNKFASSLSKKNSYRVALIYPRYIKFFWEQVTTGFNKAIDEIEDYGLRVDTYRSSPPNVSAKEFLKQIIDSGNYHGIAISAGEEDVTEMINYGIDLGIKICTFNMDVKESHRLFHVGANYREAGRLAGELICKFTKKEGKVAILGKANDFQTREKNEGFLDVASGFSKIEVFGPYSILGPNNSLKLPNDILKEVDAVYVSTAEIFEFADYLSSSSTKHLIVVGHDLNFQMVKHLKSGVISATINQDPIGQGYYTLIQLFNYLAFSDGRPFPSDIKSKLEIVMKENVDFYV